MTKYNEKYSYDVKNNGYEIYINGELVITQYDQYSKIYVPSGTFEENAIAQIEDLAQSEEQEDMMDRMKYAVENGLMTKELFQTITGQDFDELYPA